MDCAGCHAKCCTKLVKFVTIQDVARIAHSLHIDPIEFVEVIP